jgi:hypothetical protein
MIPGVDWKGSIKRRGVLLSVLEAYIRDGTQMTSSLALA